MKALQNILDGLMDGDINLFSMHPFLKTLLDSKLKRTMQSGLFWLPKDFEKINVEVNEFLDCCQPIKYKSNRWKRDWWYAYIDAFGYFSLMKVHGYFYINFDHADNVNYLHIDHHTIKATYKEKLDFEYPSKCKFYMIPEEFQETFDKIFKKLVQ